MGETSGGIEGREEMLLTTTVIAPLLLGGAEYDSFTDHV